MFYSIYDNQVGRYLFSGRNSKTKAEAIEAGYDFLSSDFDEEDRVSLPKEEYEEILIGVGLEVEEHEDEIDEWEN